MIKFKITLSAHVGDYCFSFFLPLYLHEQNDKITCTQYRVSEFKDLDKHEAENIIKNRSAHKGEQLTDNVNLENMQKI